MAVMIVHLICSTVALVLHSAAVVSDTMVIVLTWMKTFGLKRIADKLHIKARLSTILLRDGTIYFGFANFHDVILS